MLCRLLLLLPLPLYSEVRVDEYVMPNSRICRFPQLASICNSILRLIYLTQRNQKWLHGFYLADRVRFIFFFFLYTISGWVSNSSKHESVKSALSVFSSVFCSPATSGFDSCRLSCWSIHAVATIDDCWKRVICECGRDLLRFLTTRVHEDDWPSFASLAVVTVGALAVSARMLGSWKGIHSRVGRRIIDTEKWQDEIQLCLQKTFSAMALRLCERSDDDQQSGE